jgi:PhnB protein
MMKNLAIPHGYQRVMPYLILNDAQIFLDFVTNIFNASTKMKHIRDDGTIMHAEIQIGESTIMFAESDDKWKPQVSGLFIYVENADETFKKALEEGATSVLQLRDREYGRSGGIVDPCGNTWWITSIQSVQ